VKSTYSKFLHTADLESWQECLQSYRDLVCQSAQISLQQLAEGLCVAHYTRWLASLCGEQNAKQSAKDTIDKLVDIAFTYRLNDLDDDVLVKSVIAAVRDYTKTAKAMLKSFNKEIPLEILLLVTSDIPSKRAQELKKYIYATKNQVFLPAVYLYGHALLNLGYFKQLQTLLNDYSYVESNPLMIDLQGKLVELEGDWAKALTIYGKSNWDVHEYRCSICSVIVNAATGELPAWSDEKLLRAMLTVGLESDQAEVARNASFVNACRWYNFDNWLVYYELGSLSFRRRRHAEADKHLKTAGKQAPERFRFAINFWRFVNLTWLGGRPLVRSLPVEAETLECAHEALEADGPEDMKAEIRTWVASTTNDLSILTPVYHSDNIYEQAQADIIKGRTPYAFQCWSETIAESYVPRAFHSLIDIFSSCKFVQTSIYLCDVAMNESWDNFFQLWELAKEIHMIMDKELSGFSAKHFKERFSKIQKRLDELSEFEFPHLMRSWQLYKDCGRADLAVHVLQRADQLAESPEEHLILAIVREKDDKIGLEHLQRAERESTHRLERLEIAKELTRYGQITRARRILKEERVFELDESLEPLEYVIALQCDRPCLTEEQIKALSKRADAHLENDLQAGLIKRYGDQYIKRLDKFIKRLDNSASTSLNIKAWQTQTENLEESGESLWNSWPESLKRLDDTTLLEEERTKVKNWVTELGENKIILFFYIEVWKKFFDILDSILDSIKRQRPAREPADTPISRTDLFAENFRAKTVSRLWRDYLTEKESERASDLLLRVKDFYREEKQLEDEWETLRHEECQSMLKKAGYKIKYGRDLLAQIRNQMDKGSIWPMFLEISKHIYSDIDTLLNRFDTEIHELGNLK